MGVSIRQRPAVVQLGHWCWLKPSLMGSTPFAEVDYLQEIVRGTHWEARVAMRSVPNRVLKTIVFPFLTVASNLSNSFGVKKPLTSHTYDNAVNSAR